MSRNNVLDTINAAATAFISSDDHQSSPIPKKRKRWNRILICFRPTRKRIGKASLVPEPVQETGYRITALPFIAPPSSPASFFQSEPTSATQSPVGILSFSPIPCSNNNNNNNNINRPSIFAVGPYAYEAHQLVSPPVFSTYTTEPSSAPMTPVFTTPSSPEVPFARLFSNLNVENNVDRFAMSNYEFQFYQLPPGSPLGQLISPSSVVSGSGLLSVATTPRERKVACKPVSFDLDSDHVIRCVDQKLRTTFPEASNDEDTSQDSSLGLNKEFDFGTDEKHLTVEENRGSNKNEWSFFPVMQSGTLS